MPLIYNYYYISHSSIPVTDAIFFSEPLSSSAVEMPFLTLTLNNMAPTSINHLPIELHTSIFKFLFTLSREPSPLDQSEMEFGSESEDLTEEDIRSLSCFPFNVAAVSKLWRDILALIPEYWTRVVFDVAKDPTPLLDAFSWSENLENIEVLVFDSNDPQIVDKKRESSRVAAITQALQPHIYRCKSIKFDVSYSTSLPPPTVFFLREAPYLEDLTLNCCIDDLDLQSDARATNVNWHRHRFATSFPKLNNLSLTGFWFMYLALQAFNPQWLNQLKVDVDLSLTIARFKFPQYGHFTLLNFISYVSGMRYAKSLYFCNLSLSYTFGDQERVYGLDLSGDIYFQSVSKDFLHHLHAMATICAEETLSFEACEIPKMPQPHFGECLTLKNIINEDSLRHILEVWSGGNLTIDSCPSFNDTILSWLASDEYPPISGYHDASPSMATNASDAHNHTQHPREPVKEFPAGCLTSLTIEKCDNFSAHAVRELIRLRDEAYLAEVATDRYCQLVIESLHVTVSKGGPMLTDEDRRWFEQDGESTIVYWMVQDDQGTREVFRSFDDAR